MKLITNKKILLTVFTLILPIFIALVVYLFLELKPNKNLDPDLIKFENGLKEIKLRGSRFENLYELYNLVGKPREEIESKYPYYIIQNQNYTYAEKAYYIDLCVIIFYEDDIVTQVSTGADDTSNCIDPNLNFNTETRLNKLGKEDFIKKAGWQGFGEYNYISKGAVITYRKSSIWQVWFTKPMSLENYNKNFELINWRFEEYKVNRFDFTDYSRPTLDMKIFEEGLAQIPLVLSKFHNLYEVSQLIGKSKEEIEKNYEYHKVREIEYGVRAGTETVYTKLTLYELDDCITIYYKDNKVNQASINEFSQCLSMHFIFDRQTRLALLGREDKEDRFWGLPGAGEYSYITKGLVFIKNNSNLAYVWFGEKMSLEEYDKRYYDYHSDARELRLDSFGYLPTYSEDPYEYAATPEE